jgi:tripartite-type tricarboxylate transporter receptor subunit TctC
MAPFVKHVPSPEEEVILNIRSIRFFQNTDFVFFLSFLIPTPRHSFSKNRLEPLFSINNALFLVLFCFSFSIHCQSTNFPNKPIKIICPAAPGGISDLLSRIMAQRLSPLYAQQVIVDNRAGSGGHVAGEYVAKSPPDGYTLLQATIAHNAAYAMYTHLTYDPLKDLQPIVLLGESQGVLVVHPSLPVHDIKQFIQFAKIHSDQLNYGSAGTGTAIHMATELFKWMAQIKLVHIAYKGSAPAMLDLIGGNIQLMFENVATATPYVISGKIRPLGVTGVKHAPNLPGIEPISSSGLSGYEAVPYYTLSTGSKVPPDIVRKLAFDVDQIVRADNLQQRWLDLGVDVLGGTPANALERNRIESSKWTRVINAAHIQAD